MTTVIDAAPMFLRRRVKPVPSLEDRWNAAIAETLARHCPQHPIPKAVALGFTQFVFNYCEFTGKREPEEVDLRWLWQHFGRLSGTPGGGAA